MNDLLRVIWESMILFGTECIVSGAVLSSYQRDRLLGIAEILGLKAIAPLWHTDQERMIKNILSRGYEFMIIKTSAEGIKNFIGTRISKKNLQSFMEIVKEQGISPIGEGGEYESLLLDAPFFKKKLVIDRYEKSCKENQCLIVVKTVFFKDKT